MKRKVRQQVPPHRIDVFSAVGHAVMHRRRGANHQCHYLSRQVPYGVVRKTADRLEDKVLSRGVLVTWTLINGLGHSGTWPFPIQS